MAKILWLALLCAPLLGALFIVTTIIKAGMPPDRPAAPIKVGTPPFAKDDDEPFTKADRLPLSGSPSPTSDAENGILATIEPGQPDPPPPTISPAPPLTSKPAATSSTRPPARRHATRSPTVRRRSQPERLQQAPSRSGQIDETTGVTSWHWHAGSEVIKRR